METILLDTVTISGVQFPANWESTIDPHDASDENGIYVVYAFDCNNQYRRLEEHTEGWKVVDDLSL